MGYRHDRDDMLRAAVELTAEAGLGALTFAAVATRLGTNDRMVVYYFPTKSELIGAVVAALGERLQLLLADAFGPDPLPVLDLARRAWPVLATPQADPVFAVFFEAIGQAAAGREPYATLAPGFVDGWIDWLVPHVDAEVPARRPQAQALVAQLDGLLLLRRISGARVANSAARQLGFAD